MIVVGLTGSIGMGKSTTASLFAEQGIPVNNSDQVVHDLYREEAAPLVAAVFPEAVEDGVVDRKKLAENLAKNPANFKVLEAIVHPLVRAREREFLDGACRSGADIAVLDIPLLFETGAEDRVDVVVVVTCDPQIQKERVLRRPGMTEEKFNLILSRQIPDKEKRARADFIVDTGHGIESARSQVGEIVSTLRRRPSAGE
ncbi:dephospho-CoA kinase [Ciceribacter sp. RN22]|uniref:dephospho-CoA kinase n=1 Tax=Ciceribacter sp. RN22 TaxID=2954932 RepID=UPI00209218A7|nr:dephospho-CoA kinase [Ciceribacter sp. RN22]MCO6180663.1 dephospho-CoA kinase [Ciceribacter sp. RN22]